MTGGIIAAGSAQAGEVEILNAIAAKSDSKWSFSVTIRHADEGWDHYADLWQVVAPDGTVLGERVLLHPHVDEQPFTRSLNGVEIPDGVTEVVIRARDNVHGFSSQEFPVDLEE
ncbi:hypothetical protein E1297_14635 [Roseibium sp. RKSG952]|nr:hypothetical protein [Roseibium sp. RKSG952]